MRQITIDDLKQCASLINEIRDNDWRIQRINDLITNCTPRYGVEAVQTTRETDAMTRYIIQLEELKEKLNDDSIIYSAQVDAIRDTINTIKDSRIRRIMRFRYIDGLTWAEVSEQTNYVESWCRKLCEQGENIVLGKEEHKRAGETCYYDIEQS